MLVVNCFLFAFLKRVSIGVGGGEGGQYVGCRLKFHYFVACQLKFSTFVGSR